MPSTNTCACLTLDRNSVNPARNSSTGFVMDIFALFATRVADALAAQFPDLAPELLARVVVEPPRDPAHGDLSTNAAMVVAKPMGRNPRDVANALAAHFSADPDVTAVDVAGPGFINFRLADAVWHRVLRSVAVAGEDFGRADIGKGERVNVEYVSANPTGPCMWATPAAPSSAMRWPRSWPGRAMT